MAKPTNYQRGNRALVSKRYEEAIGLFESHAAAFPEDLPDALTQAGLCYERWKARDGWPKAEKLYRRALEKNPSFFRALIQLARILPERSSERFDVLQRASQLQDNQLVLLALGDYFRSVSKDFDSAHRTYRRIQSLWPRDKPAYLRLIDLCRRNGRSEEAADWSQQWQKVRTR